MQSCKMTMSFFSKISNIGFLATVQEFLVPLFKLNPVITVTFLGFILL